MKQIRKKYSFVRELLNIHRNAGHCIHSLHLNLHILHTHLYIRKMCM